MVKINYMKLNTGPLCIEWAPEGTIVCLGMCHCLQGCEPVLLPMVHPAWKHGTSALRLTPWPMMLSPCPWSIAPSAMHQTHPLHWLLSIHGTGNNAITSNWSWGGLPGLTLLTSHPVLPCTLRFHPHACMFVVYYLHTVCVNLPLLCIVLPFLHSLLCTVMHIRSISAICMLFTTRIEAETFVWMTCNDTCPCVHFMLWLSSFLINSSVHSWSLLPLTNAINYVCVYSSGLMRRLVRLNFTNLSPFAILCTLCCHCHALYVCCIFLAYCMCEYTTFVSFRTLRFPCHSHAYKINPRHVYTIYYLDWGQNIWPNDSDTCPPVHFLLWPPFVYWWTAVFTAICLMHG